MKRALVLGGGGFIGSHMIKRLKQEGFWVQGVDMKMPKFSPNQADEFIVGDLTDPAVCSNAFKHSFDEIYQFAADMGGAGYIFTGENDADIMHNSALINLNVLNECKKTKNKRIFYSSSACIYPEFNQTDPRNPICSEASAYPAQPDSEYGWEKLFSERLYFAYAKNHGIEARIARYHNVFGPEGAWNDGKEKAPAALCRKVAQAEDGGTIQVWGDGQQTRSFLYIDECLNGTQKLMRSEFSGPVNVGSDEMVTINELAQLIINISGKSIQIENIPGPLGVRGRCSDNKLIFEKLDWRPSSKLVDGLSATYQWIESQVK
jgi:GDP-D-mannose 3',5'-epimerase